MLRPLLTGPVLVDNDVNWAALAERDARLAQGQDLQDFVYLYLGEGVGCAVVADGAVRRGHRGIAGEVAHLTVTGPGGTALPLTELFARLGPAPTRLDRHRRRPAAGRGAPAGRRPDQGRRAGARAGRDLVAAAIAFCDPECVVLGGPWGTDERRPRPACGASWTATRAASRWSAAVSAGEPSLTGARTAALAALRADIVARIAA